MVTDKKFLSTAEAFSMFGGVLALATFNRRLADGSIPSVKIGNRRLIPAKFFDDLESQAMAGVQE